MPECIGYVIRWRNIRRTGEQVSVVVLGLPVRLPCAYAGDLLFIATTPAATRASPSPFRPLVEHDDELGLWIRG